eukprot:GILI01013599.1.p1 GENE.GILI01013599.1~~GILI01013599.1.p1  ORF type:complete len:137 (-),score=36.91 GILI01013599.1:101-460(-)
MQVPHTHQKEVIRHPIDVMQSNSRHGEWAKRMHNIRTTHGWAAAARISMDNSLMLSTRRLGGLPSSNILYNSYNGNLTDMDVDDVYGLQENDPRVKPTARTCFELEFYGEEATVKPIKI